MSYIEFDKSKLVNLAYSLNHEILRSNRAGAYASSTIVGCNTRKYHGLLVVTQPKVDKGMHVLLSYLDETVVQQGQEFNLAIHKYKGDNYNPKGHKYLTNIEFGRIPVFTYTVGGVVLTKEMVFAGVEDSVIIKYTLVSAHSPTFLRFRPFLAFRNIHTLTKANADASRHYEQVTNGIKIRMYDKYDYLYMQFSKEPVYHHVPDWYYDFEYMREKENGYEYLEDLYTPGFFEIPINVGESIYFIASLEERNPVIYKGNFTKESNKRIKQNCLQDSLSNAAQQFMIRKEKDCSVISAFPWMNFIARETFIALPGLTLLDKDTKTFKCILDNLISQMNGAFFPDNILDKTLYQSADAPLWFFWTLQQYIKYGANPKIVWKQYGEVMLKILKIYRKGTSYEVFMNADTGLLHTGIDDIAVTWMNMYVDGKPVTPRVGYCVEINALWYNAIRFVMELTEKSKEIELFEEWKNVAVLIEENFMPVFWNEDKKCLYDYVNDNYKNEDVRPNQLYAASLPYVLLDEAYSKAVLDKITSKLLTPRGLRTLSPNSKDYISQYKGNESERNKAYHQGSVFPYLICQFTEAFLKIHDYTGFEFIKKIYKQFDDMGMEYGVGTIAEVYDADPPHASAGAVSQAWNVAELRRLGNIIKSYEKSIKKEMHG